MIGDKFSFDGVLKKMQLLSDDSHFAQAQHWGWLLVALTTAVTVYLSDALTITLDGR